MSGRVVIFLCFFLSGVAGLIYEVVWAKYLSLFLGNTAPALAAPSAHGFLFPQLPITPKNHPPRRAEKP